jgi:hypothetical protein
MLCLKKRHFPAHISNKFILSLIWFEQTDRDASVMYSIFSDVLFLELVKTTLLNVQWYPRDESRRRKELGQEDFSWHAV